MDARLTAGLWLDRATKGIAASLVPHYFEHSLVARRRSFSQIIQTPEVAGRQAVLSAHQAVEFHGPPNQRELAPGGVFLSGGIHIGVENTAGRRVFAGKIQGARESIVAYVNQH